MNVVKSIYQKAAYDLAIEDAIASGKLSKKPTFMGMTRDQIAAKKAELLALYLPNEDEMTDIEVAEYNMRLVEYVITKSTSGYSVDYYGYNTYIMNLEETFKTLCGLLVRPSGSNPIGFYDELVSYLYNFDSQTYEFRLANRVAIQYKLTNAIGMLAFHYQVAAYPDSARYDLIGDAYDKAMKSDIWTVSGHPASEIKANPHMELMQQEEYIKEVMLWDGDSSADAKEHLIKRGYTPIDQDLDQGVGNNHYIYLGYKTTNNYDEAIGDFYLFKGTASKDMKVDGVKYNMVDPVDDGSYNLCLYYTKTKKNGAVHSISFNNTKPGNILKNADSTGDFNQGQGGKDIFMYVEKAQKGQTFDTKIQTETNPEYYPFSYVLGRKISVYISDKVAVDYDLEMKAMGNVKTSWTEDEITEFIDRCQQNSLFGGELKSAGIRANQMFNGIGTSVFYLSTNYVRKYSKSDDRYYIEYDGMIMDDAYYRNEYVEYNGRQALAKKNGIYYFKFQDGWWWNQHTDYEHSAMYFILN